MAVTQLLNHEQINQKINRMAYQLYEHYYLEDEIILAGISQRGMVLAEKIAKSMQQFYDKKITLITLTVEKDHPFDDFAVKRVDAAVFAHKTVVVIDDVLNSGKTLLYGVCQFLHAPVKQLSTLVLIDRNHKSYPVQADFVGISLATTMKQNISVVFDSGNDNAYLE